MDHEGQHTHLGGTALVQFLGTVVVLGFCVIGTNESNGESRGGEVTRVRSFSLLPSGKFKDTTEGKDLKGTRDRDGERGIPARSKVRELGSVRGDISREVDAGLVDQVSNNTKHADTSMLDFNTTKAVELSLVTVSNKSQRIEESKRTVVVVVVLLRNNREKGVGTCENKSTRGRNRHDDYDDNFK